MENADVEQLTALLQAVLVGVTSLMRSHPDPQRLSTTFDQLAQTTPPHGHRLYAQTLATLRRAIP